MTSIGIYPRHTTRTAKAVVTGLPTTGLLLVLVLIGTILGAQT